MGNFYNSNCNVNRNLFVCLFYILLYNGNFIANLRIRGSEMEPVQEKDKDKDGWLR